MIRHLQLRIPNGHERTYTPAEVVVCTRADDHAALIAASTDACRSLRDACRIHYDEHLSTDLIGLLMAIHGTVKTRLEITLDPAAFDAPADSEQAKP